MMKKIIILVLIVSFLVIFCVNLKAIGLSDPTEENAGYALLDTVFVTFKELAEMKETVMEKTQKALTGMMHDAKNAKAQNHIDEVFFKRFHRTLLVLNPEAGLYELKSDKDYDKNLVIWNGNWIRAPRIVKKSK